MPALPFPHSCTSTGPKQCCPNNHIWLHRHLPHDIHSLVYKTSSSQQIHHASIMLNLRHNRVIINHRLEMQKPVSHQPHMRAGRQNPNKSNTVRPLSRPLHPFKQTQSISRVPCMARLLIIVFQVIISFTSKPSNTSRAFSITPHFAYMSIKAFPTNKFPLYPILSA